MQIGELAARAGVTPRVLRHYEERGLLRPRRSSGGYRLYDDGDIVTVAQVRMMIDAGLSTHTIARYLDCVRGDATTVDVDLCPTLRAELDAVAARLDDDSDRIHRTRHALDRLTRPRRG